MNQFAPVDPGAGDVVGLLAALALATTVLWLLARRILAPFTVRQRAIIAWFLAALCGVTLAFGWLAISVSPLSATFIADAGSYHGVIVELGDRLPSWEGPTRWGDRAVFLYLMAIAQAVFGLNGYVSVVVNALLVGVMLLAMVDLTRLLNGTRVATATAAVVALLPATAYWSATPLREALVLCLTALSVNGAVRIVVCPGPWAWLLTIVPVVLMVRTREVQVISLVCATTVATAVLLWDRLPHQARRILLHPSTVVIVCGCALAVTMALGPHLHRAALIGAQEAQSLTSLLQDASSATSPSLDRTGPQQPAQVLLRAPGALATYLWGPSPTSAAPPPMIVEAASFWVLTPFVLFGGWLAIRQRCRAYLVVIAAAAPAAMIGALTLGNHGIISRIRLSTWILLLPLAGWAIANLASRRRRSAWSADTRSTASG